MFERYFGIKATVKKEIDEIWILYSGKLTGKEKDPKGLYF
jgi:hypothetical protein